MKERTRGEPRVRAVAERQMQAWMFDEEIADRAQRADSGEASAEQLHHYVTLSREAGAGGGDLAPLLGQTLGWEVLDKDLLGLVADRCDAHPSALEAVDETSPAWLRNLCRSWLDPKMVPHEKFVFKLREVVLAAVSRGNVVLVGRGAQFFLPPDLGVAVRIIASEKYRIAQLMRRHGMEEAAARRFMVEIDQGRREFVARFFHRDIDDPHLYDLVINVERLGPEATVEQIVVAYRRRAAEARSP